MNDRVWISHVLDNYDIGMKQGSRTKFYSCDWNPAKFELPLSPDNVYQASQSHRKGCALKREDFPESEAVWNRGRFSKISDIFNIGPFYAVKDELAEVLSRFDLGDGGLIPFTIYEADLETPYPGEYWLLNFGCIKNTLLPEQSENVVKGVVRKATGQQLWKVNSWHEDGDVVLSSAALKGPDLWFEDILYNKIFLSDALAQAIIDIGMKEVFRLKECQVTGKKRPIQEQAA